MKEVEHRLPRIALRESSSVGPIGGDNSFQVSAFGGVADGGPVKLWQNCALNNTDCTWTYKNGTILSDTNPLIGIRSSDHPVDG